MFAAIPLIQKILGGVMLALVMFLGFNWWAADRRADKFEAQLQKCVTAREADHAAYKLAQAQALAKNLAEVARIESEQKEATDEVSRNLNARLEHLRSELRNSKPAAPQGAAGGSQAGPNGAPPGGPDGKAGLCLSPEELLRSAENEERHDQLITWIEKQLQIQR